MTARYWPPAALLAAFLTAGCAGQPPEQRTIEPRSARGTATAASPAGASPADKDFVLSRKAKTSPAPDTVAINTGDKWFKFRSSYLKTSETQAKERDNAISEVTPPQKFWDDQTSGEAISLWIAVCTECHGGRRRVEDVMAMPPPPEWGRGEGLFFGIRRRYPEVFFTIFRGGPVRNGVPSEMPAWRGKIPKEMIWALLYFLEYQSGGVEARFPPSLFPRKEGLEQREQR